MPEKKKKKGLTDEMFEGLGELRQDLQEAGVWDNQWETAYQGVAGAPMTQQRVPQASGEFVRPDAPIFGNKEAQPNVFPGTHWKGYYPPWMYHGGKTLGTPPDEPWEDQQATAGPAAGQPAYAEGYGPIGSDPSVPGILPNSYMLGPDGQLVENPTPGVTQRPMGRPAIYPQEGASMMQPSTKRYPEPITGMTKNTSKALQSYTDKGGGAPQYMVFEPTSVDGSSGKLVPSGWKQWPHGSGEGGGRNKGFLPGGRHTKEGIQGGHGWRTGYGVMQFPIRDWHPTEEGRRRQVKKYMLLDNYAQSQPFDSQGDKPYVHGRTVERLPAPVLEYPHWYDEDMNPFKGGEQKERPETGGKPNDPVKKEADAVIRQNNKRVKELSKRVNKVLKKAKDNQVSVNETLDRLKVK